jgi:hypothetical protein
MRFLDVDDHHSPMQYRLRTLLIANVASIGIGMSLIGLAMIGIGVFVLLTPAQHLLQSDRKTARWLNEREMKVSGDRNRAIANAALFYRLFGCALIIFGLVWLVSAWIPGQPQ